MRYAAIVTSYDRTLTKTGRMDAELISAFERLRASGRRAILVTRREFHDIAWACPRLDLFDYVVAESGRVLHRSAAWETAHLADRQGATSASAVERALREMRLSGDQLVAIGSEASDEGFLVISGLAVATADASDAVKQRAMLVTSGSSGDGVIEIIDEIVRNDLRQVVSSLPVHKGKTQRHLPQHSLLSW